MHPRQAFLMKQASEIASQTITAAKKPAVPTQAILWKYTDPEGHIFYMEEKKTTVKSPYSGKNFTIKPERFTPAQVGKELKDEIAAGRTKEAVLNDLAQQSKEAAKKVPAPSLAILWKYVDPEGNNFYLEVKKTTVKSPFNGKNFTTKPERFTPAQVGKEMKEEAKASKAKTASEVDRWKL